MAKKRVYVETTVISYLTARPAKKPIPRLRQLVTADWWERRQRWELFVSPVVMLEIRRGDSEAALKRLEKADGLPVLPESEEARRLADHLIVTGSVPESKYDDALHIAIASVHGMDYLVTWNQKHIFKPERIEALYKTVRETGNKPAVLIRPDDMLEERHGS